MSGFQEYALNRLGVEEVTKSIKGLFDVSQLKDWENEVSQFVKTVLRDVTSEAERQAKIKEFTEKKMADYAEKIFEKRYKKETELLKQGQETDRNKYEYLRRLKEEHDREEDILNSAKKNIEEDLANIEEKLKLNKDDEELLRKKITLEAERAASLVKEKELNEAKQDIEDQKRRLFEDEVKFSNEEKKYQERQLKEERERKKRERNESIKGGYTSSEDKKGTNWLQRSLIKSGKWDHNREDRIENTLTKLFGNKGSAGSGADDATQALSGSAGKLSSAAGALSTAATVLSAVGDYYSKAIDDIEEFMNGAVPSINTRLEGIGVDFSLISERIIRSLSFDNAVDSRKVVENISKLIDSGVAYDIEQRAFLQTVSQDIHSTFDAFDGNLMRIIRLQQEDSTYIRMGMEKSLNDFLTSNFKDSSYLNTEFDNVSAALIEATSIMGSLEATEFEHSVHKWLGSLQAMGASDNFITQIATAIGQLGSGNISQLSGSAAEKLILQSAIDSGLDYASILTNGLDSRGANALLANLTNYLGNVARTHNNNNVVASEFGRVFGFSLSDLRAASNLIGSGNFSNIALTERDVYDFADTTYELTSGLADNLTFLKQAERATNNEKTTTAMMILNRKSGQIATGIGNIVKTIPIVGGTLGDVVDSISTGLSGLTNWAVRGWDAIIGDNKLYTGKSGSIDDFRQWVIGNDVVLSRDGGVVSKYTAPQGQRPIVGVQSNMRETPLEERYINSLIQNYNKNSYKTLSKSEATSYKIKYPTVTPETSELPISNNFEENVQQQFSNTQTQLSESIVDNSQQTVADISGMLESAFDRAAKKQSFEVYDIYEGLFDDSEKQVSIQSQTLTDIFTSLDSIRTEIFTNNTPVTVKADSLDNTYTLLNSILSSGSEAVKVIITGMDSEGGLELPVRLGSTGERNFSEMLYKNVTAEVQGGAGYSIAALMELLISWISRNGAVNVNLASSDVNIREIVTGESSSDKKDSYMIDTTRPKGSGVGTSPVQQSSLFKRLDRAEALY